MSKAKTQSEKPMLKPKVKAKGKKQKPQALLQQAFYRAWQTVWRQGSWGGGVTL
jgi:hypothetical protein